MDCVCGFLVAILFHNHDNKYSVIKIRLDQKKDENIVIIGYFDIPKKEELVKYFGKYIEHPRFGRQFQIESLERVLPGDNEGVIRFLSSSLFPKIGEATAKKIIDALGDDCLNKIQENPSVLDDVNIKKEHKKTISEVLQKHMHLNESMNFFISHGLNMKELIKLDSFYKDRLLSIVKANPYTIVEDVDGIGFKTADRIAKSMGIEDNDPRRIKAAIVYALSYICFHSQDTYTDLHNVFHQCRQQVEGLDDDTFFYHFNSLVSLGKIIMEGERIFPLELYVGEKNIAKYLFPYLKKRIGYHDDKVIEKEVTVIEENLGIKYETEQKAAIKSAVTNGLTIITGGPGTGKTTILQAIIKLMKKLNTEQRIILCAPTGRASKRMSDLSGVEASTIHRLLAWDLDTNRFAKNFENPVEGDVLIVDEFSMVDTILFYRLLDATTSFKQLILIGDDEQLPPVSPGDVLHDLLAMNYPSTISLVKIHRQSEKSGIIPLSYNIRHGSFNDYDITGKDDITYLPCQHYQIKDYLVKVIKNLLEAGFDQKDMQVLVPKYDGIVGITNLNDLLQNIFNPYSIDKKEIVIGRNIYRINDKILQLKNQPDDDVYNGDIGILEEIVLKEESEDGKDELLINFDGNLVRYTSATFINITLAYCISVHKSQGSEYPIVIMPMDYEYRVMLKRKLIYTGITRTKKHLFIIGNAAAFKYGVEHLEIRKRNSSLQERLYELFAPK